MATIAQQRAEVDRLNQAMADRTRVPSNMPKFTGNRGEDDRDGMFQIENACRINDIPIEDTNTRLPGIAGSAMEKPVPAGSCTADIETYDGEYSALIFRVEGMSVLDQVLCYANGLKPRTRSYVKLENPPTLSDAMDLAVKYEMIRFVDEVRDRQPKRDKKFSSAEHPQAHGKPFRGRSAGRAASSRELSSNVLKVVPASAARTLVTSRLTVIFGKRSRKSRETGNHVSEIGSCRGRELNQNTKV
ncbi:hypothetical protein ON010_g4313 [Phytophthora cinnamomi]|nr:hypothetical protein ON010_g4313 [Phytophthora cinnamomi]